jgi:hypothetical protein
MLHWNSRGSDHWIGNAHIIVLRADGILGGDILWLDHCSRSSGGDELVRAARSVNFVIISERQL